MRPARWLLAATIAIPGACDARTVHAAEPDRAACVSAYEDAQGAMRRSNLRTARAQLGECLSDSCPGVLRSDCARWLKEVETRLPAVVIGCEGPDGLARSAVRVVVDGVEIADHLDGKAIEMDPGEHTFRFELLGEAPLETRFVVREGDKLQRLGARFPRASVAETMRPVPWTVYALAGLGVATGAAFAYAGLAGTAAKSDLESCTPDCPHDQVSAVRTKFVVADVFLGLSLLSFGAATYLYLTRGTTVRAGATSNGASVSFARAF